MKHASKPPIMVNVDLPQAHDAERSVLGAVFVENERLADVASTLQPEHFGQPWCRVVYQAILQLARQNQPIDFITVKHAIGEAGLKVVNLAMVAALPDGVPRGVNVGHYARIVVDHARRRAAIRQAEAVIESAVEVGAEADDVITRAQEGFFRLAQSRRGDRLFSAEQLTRELSEDFEERERRDHQMQGVGTGVHDLDTMTHGLQPGELVVIGARPSIGKTALALQMGLHAALSATTVLMCSLEMGHRSVWRRALFNMARVDGYRYLRGHLKGDRRTYGRIGQAVTKLGPLPFWLCDQPGMTSTEIRARAQQVQLRHGLGLVIVDYLQLMRPADLQSSRQQNRAQQVGGMAWDLKEMAMSLNVPVIVLSQLNRGADEKDRPGMGDLRESGDIEAHADIILLLHRKETREELSELPYGAPSHIELIVEKQRGNPTGILNLLNFREQYRFASETRGDGDDQMELSA